MEKGIHRRTPIEASPALALRFWSKVQKGEPDECWPWLGCIRSSKNSEYGALGWKGKVLSAHCIAFVLEKGPIPEGLIVLHSCDNTICCNPAHLFAGTFRENFLEGVARGRIVHAVGERIWNSKLTPELVIEMRRRHAQGEPIEAIARDLGHVGKTCGKAIRGQTWGHVEPSLATLRQFIKETTNG